MERNDKMKIIAIVCAVIAVAVFALNLSGNSSGVDQFEGDMLWVICQSGQETYQMDKAEYFRWVSANQTGDRIPPMPCEECNEKAAFRAEKCPNCELIFRRHSVPNDFADRCPDCGHSEIENPLE